jgi:hypothetical protein
MEGADQELNEIEQMPHNRALLLVWCVIQGGNCSCVSKSIVCILILKLEVVFGTSLHLVGGRVIEVKRW